MNQESVWGTGSWIYTSTCFLTALIIIIIIIISSSSSKWWNSHLHSLREAEFKLSKMKDELHPLELLTTSERRKRWLKSVDVLRPEVSKILVGLARRDLDYCRRSYYLGKEAAKKLEAANQLLRAGENLQRGTVMSLFCSLCPMEDPFPGMVGYCTEVLDFAEDKDDQSLFFGVWGMRGVGKTALLRLVRDAYYFRFRNLSFNHVLFIEADTGGTMKSVQRTIAVAASGSDWATIPHDEQRSRVNHISWSLERGSFLLLLDNVPDNFDLAAAGLPIPKPGRGQKVVFTTRSQTVCDYMGCATGNSIEMRCMGEDDAWKLFCMKIRSKIIDDRPAVHQIGKQMVAECRGLPLALCVIGRAMSAKRDPKEWRNACRLLKAKRSQIQEDEGYTCLDILEAQLKDAFLVTSLWPDDGSIPNERSNL